MFNILIIIFMKKRNLFMLPCMAAVAVVTFLGMRTSRLNAYVTNSLLSQDVETLSNCECIDGKKNNGHCTQDDHLRYFCESPGLLQALNCYQ